MIKRRAAATVVRPCVRPDPGSPPSSFPQVTCLDRSGRPVLPPDAAADLLRGLISPLATPTASRKPELPGTVRLTSTPL
jgi:hypothetical protein